MQIQITLHVPGNPVGEQNDSARSSTHFVPQNSCAQTNCSTLEMVINWYVQNNRKTLTLKVDIGLTKTAPVTRNYFNWWEQFAIKTRGYGAHRKGGLLC